MKTKAEQPNKRGRRAILWIAGAVLLVLVCVCVHYRGVRPIRVLEYGSTAPTAADYTAREATLIVDDMRPSIGWHFLNLDIGGFPTPVLLRVRDTVAPSAVGVDREVALGIPLGPDAFIRDLKDADVVQLTFSTVPDFTREGELDTEIRMQDRSGNRSAVPVHISVRATHPVVTLEAGSAAPDAADFLLDGVQGTLNAPIDADRMQHVGTTRVTLTTADGIVSESVLEIVDTVAPTAEGTTVLLLPGETVDPADCVAFAADETAVQYAFADAPDYAARTVQQITVRLTDEGGNTTDVASTLLISGVRPNVIEARTEPLNALDFRNDEGDEIEVPAFVPDTPGTYPLDIRTNGIAQTVAVTVVDTTPPELRETALSETFYSQHAYAPETFFNAQDVTDVTMWYDPEPDWTRGGEQTLTAYAEDTSGNRASRSHTVTLVEDKTAPRIYGVIDRVCYVNEPIAYGSEVFAEDDADGRLELSIESEVLTYAEGTYRVVYRAVDQSGNEATAECNFTLIQQTVTEEEIRQMAKDVMAKITTPDMVDAEKLKAIFDYVQGHVVYVNGSNSNYIDWRKAAYDGFTYGMGDCYNIYSVTRALLDETGIPYLSVERLKVPPWKTRHFWVHVNVGTGWYCFDPTWTQKHQVYCFMWSKSERSGMRHYWNYDESKYPPMATEHFDYDAVVEMERQARNP